MIWLQQLANPIPLVFEATFHFAFKIILLRSLLRIWLFADSLLVYSIVTSICYNEGISCRYSVPNSIILRVHHPTSWTPCTDYFRVFAEPRVQLLHRPPRAPVTVADLYTLLSYITESSYSANHKALFRSTCLLAFFAMLRASEFTARQLLPQDITFNNSSYDVGVH